MIDGNEVEIYFINKRSLATHLSARHLYLSTSIGKKLSGYGAGSGHGNNTRLVTHSFFNRFNILLDFFITFKIQDKHLVFLKSKLMPVYPFQLCIDNDGSGYKSNGQSELKNHQR